MVDIYSYRQCFYKANGWGMNNILNILYKQNDVYGKNSVKTTLLHYHIAYYLGILIRDDIDNTNKTWAYYTEKYNLINLYNRLMCFGINLNKILNCIGLPNVVNINPKNNDCLPPAQPSAIVLNTSDWNVLYLTGGTFTVSNVPGVTYTWTVPSYLQINTGQGTNSIFCSANIDAPLIAEGEPFTAIVIVTPSNGCGKGVRQTYTISNVD
jgi:hypothetical protein